MIYHDMFQDLNVGNINYRLNIKLEKLNHKFYHYLTLVRK